MVNKEQSVYKVQQEKLVKQEHKVQMVTKEQLDYRVQQEKVVL